MGWQGMSDITIPNEFIAFAGEVMLAKKMEGKHWQVTFDLAMEQDFHPFNKYTGRATGKQGTRFKAILIEIDDQDEPINQDLKNVDSGATMGQYDKLKGKALVKESGILRNDLSFQKFLYSKLFDMNSVTRNALLGELPYKLLMSIQKTQGVALKNGDNGVRFANHMVHYLCSVHSCREFKYNKNAALEFIELRQEFINWARESQKRGES